MTNIPIFQLDPSFLFMTHTISSTLDVISEVQRPDSGRYVTVLPVKDYLNICKSGTEGILSSLDASDIDALRNGRTILVLDISNEGPEFYGFIFDIFHSELDRYGIGKRSIVFLSQNRFLGIAYNRYYGGGINFWSCDYFPKAIALWMQTGGERDDDFPHTDYTPLGDTGEPRFLSFNAAARWHRLLLYRWLQMEGMLAEGLVSFHGVNSANPKSNEIDIDNPPQEIAEAFPELLSGIKEWMPAAPQTLNDTAASGNHLIMTIDKAAYTSSLLSIVTESDFFASGIERLTEKSLKAAGMGHPFIIIGAPRSVGRLAELGFCTFSGLIDHSYDLVDDSDQRLFAAFRSIRETWKRIKADPDGWRKLAKEEADFNYRHAKQGLVERIDQIMTKPIVQRLRHFVDHGII